MMICDEISDSKKRDYLYIEVAPERQDPLLEIPRPFDELANAVNWARSERYRPLYTVVDARGAIMQANDTLSLLQWLNKANPRAVWLYDAALTLSWIDAWLLRQKGWGKLDSGEMSDKTYRDITGRDGQRYELTLCMNYSGSRAEGTNRHKRKHYLHFYDLMQIVPGGVENLMPSESRNKPPTRHEGREWYSYKGKTVIAALRHYSAILRERFGLCLTGARPDARTAGGIAKKIYLNECYDGQVKNYRKAHPMSVELDRWYRSNWLYTGGLLYLAQDKRDTALPKVWRYDVNAKYGKEIADMPELVGATEWLDPDEYDENDADCVYIWRLCSIEMQCKPNMAPIWRDPHHKINRELYLWEQDGDGDYLLMYDEELKELSNWYDIIYTADAVGRTRTRKNDRFAPCIGKLMELKDYAKETHDDGLKNLAKMLIVGISGKLAQDPVYDVYVKRIDPVTGCVVQETIGKRETETYLDIRQGALVTALGRVHLMQDLRRSLSCPREQLIYSDTDSIHSTIKPEGLDIDPAKLGAYKDECDGEPFTLSKYLDKKIYINAKPTADGKMTEFEVRTAGTERSKVERIIRDLDAVDAFNTFARGMPVVQDVAVTVKGGAVKIPMLKRINRDAEYVVHNYNGAVSLTVKEN